MRTKIALLAILLVATVASAQTHGRAASPSPMPPNGDMIMNGMSAATVSGTVSSVNGNSITIANGLITIDATNGKVLNGPVVAGSVITAVLKSADAPLQATVVAVMNVAQVTLTGQVHSVDTAHGQLVILGTTVVVTSDTSFVGAKSLADVQPNELAVVEANVSNGALVAARILVMAPMPQPSVTIHGTVKSIGTDSWIISTAAKDYTVVVNAQTKIVNDPKVGDTVDVLARVDSSNAYVAISIFKIPTGTSPQPPSAISVYVGTVQTLTATSLVIDDAAGKATTFVVNAQTKIAPGVAAGAKVIVAATKAADGTLTALAVGPQMM